MHLNFEASPTFLEGPRGQWTALLLSLAVTALAAAVGSAASANAPDFYRELVKPGWAPPGWIFAPVWTALYVLMAFAAWLVWRSRGRHAFGPLALYLGQLALNALWTWLFFRWRLMGWAFLEIVVLWCLLLWTLAVFRRVTRTAGWLLLPYWLWVTYAAVLNAALWRLNPNPV